VERVRGSAYIALGLHHRWKVKIEERDSAAAFLEGDNFVDLRRKTTVVSLSRGSGEAATQGAGSRCQSKREGRARAGCWAAAWARPKTGRSGLSWACGWNEVRGERASG
jgi:hypothetical protein